MYPNRLLYAQSVLARASIPPLIMHNGCLNGQQGAHHLGHIVTSAIC